MLLKALSFDELFSTILSLSFTFKLYFFYFPFIYLLTIVLSENTVFFLNTNEYKYKLVPILVHSPEKKGNFNFLSKFRIKKKHQVIAFTFE